MSNIQDLLHSGQAEQLMKDAGRLERLRDAPETQRLFQLLSRSAGGSLEQAAAQAAQGDAGTLLAAIQQLMKDPEGQALLRNMKQSVE